VYIKGATEEPSEITMIVPKINEKKIIGRSHHFFLTFKNLINSIKRFIVIYFRLFYEIIKDGNETNKKKFKEYYKSLLGS